MGLRKNLLKLIFALGLLFAIVLAVNLRLCGGQRDIEGPVDYFEMSLEELMTIEVTYVDERDAILQRDLFEMTLEELMLIEVGWISPQRGTLSVSCQA